MKRHCTRTPSPEGYTAEIVGGILAMVMFASCSAIFWPVLQRWMLVQDALVQVGRAL